MEESFRSFWGRNFLHRHRHHFHHRQQALSQIRQYPIDPSRTSNGGKFNCPGRRVLCLQIVCQKGKGWGEAVDDY